MLERSERIESSRFSVRSSGAAGRRFLLDGSSRDSFRSNPMRGVTGGRRGRGCHVSHAQKLHRQVVLLRRGRTLHHPVGHLSGQGCPVSIRTGPANRTPLICWPLNSPELSQAGTGTEMASLRRCASPRTALRLRAIPRCRLGSSARPRHLSAQETAVDGFASRGPRAAALLSRRGGGKERDALGDGDGTQDEPDSSGV